VQQGFGAAIPTINTEACPNPNGLNPHVTVERNSVRIAASGDSGHLWEKVDKCWNNVGKQWADTGKAVSICAVVVGVLNNWEKICGRTYTV
jgi:hypothetical protein